MFITPQDTIVNGDFAMQEMQEIEVVSMDDGEDNITLTSSAGSVTSSQPLASTITPPPLLPTLSSSSSSSSSLDGDDEDQPASKSILPTHRRSSSSSSQDEAFDILLGMLSKEQTLPTIDHAARSKIRGTPISISGSTNNNSFSSSNNRSSSSSPPSSSSSCPSSNLLDNDNDENNGSSDPVNDHDRTKMCDWYYEMSDFLKIERATASRSLTLLDRFMSTPVVDDDERRLSSSSSSSFSTNKPSVEQGNYYTMAGVVIAATQNRDEYQLVALTALFLSIKLYERLNIQPEHVSYLSRGRYTSDEVMKMEIIILQALEWRVCVADKVDYVNAYLDVLLPAAKSRLRSNSSSSSSSQDDEDHHHDHIVLSSFKDLANLQIQLSDFDTSFSTQRPSIVALAAVINSFEMKKDKLLSTEEQHTFLECIQRLMIKMLPAGSTKTDSKAFRQELARTMERLRILVDPPSVVTGSSYICGTGPELTPTSYQKYQDSLVYTISTADDSGSSSSSSSMSNHHTPKNHSQEAVSSPLDMALHHIEHFDMSQILCCGMPRQQHASEHALYTKGNVATDAGGGDDMEVDNATHAHASHHLNLIESATSFGSAHTHTDYDRALSGKATSFGELEQSFSKNKSPTSIANILFG